MEEREGRRQEELQEKDAAAATVAHFRRLQRQLGPDECGEGVDVDDVDCRRQHRRQVGAVVGSVNVRPHPELQLQRQARDV